MPTQGIMPLFFHRLSFSLWFSPCIAPLPLPFYFSVPLVFRIGTLSCSLLSLAVWPQPRPAPSHQWAYLSHSNWLCSMFSLYDPHCHGTANAATFSWSFPHLLHIISMSTPSTPHDPSVHASVTRSSCSILRAYGLFATKNRRVHHADYMRCSQTLPWLLSQYTPSTMPSSAVSYSCIQSLRCIFIIPCTITDGYSHLSSFPRILTPVWRM